MSKKTYETYEDLRLDSIFKRAERDIKGNYNIYNTYRRELEELELNSSEYEKAVRNLAKILKV